MSADACPHPDRPVRPTPRRLDSAPRAAGVPEHHPPLEPTRNEPLDLEPPRQLDTARLDQHLLVDRAAIDALVAYARITPDDIVVDVGAGTGAVTRALLARGPRKVYAIELDTTFRAYLQSLVTQGNPTLLWQDVLTSMPYDATKVVANPPFRITERLVRWLGTLPSLTSATLVTGTSFGACAVATPGSRDYSRLSVQVRARFRARVVTSLDRDAFHPPARGTACIVHLTRAPDPHPLDVLVADALEHHGGSRVRDLLHRLQARENGLGDRDERRRFGKAARDSEVVRRTSQQRLQALTRADLSELMAELHRCAPTGS